MNRKIAAGFAIGLIASLVPEREAAAQTAAERIIQRLSLALPLDAAMRDGVRRPLEELDREACDQIAIVNLGKALQAAGFRRDAATGHVRFSETCNGQPQSLRTAVNFLLDLGDNAAAANVASDLIKLEPFSDNGYFLRAVAYDRAGNASKAIDSYMTAIDLFAQKDRIANVGYFALARNYEKTGRSCDAAIAVESWVAANPARNDTSQTRAMIAAYVTKGNCAAPTGRGEDVYPVVRQKSVVTLPATINGVRGTFILDTGATWVSIKGSFAKKANVEIEEDSRVQLNTANGVTEGKRGRAKTVQLKSLGAKDVPLIVQVDSKGTYGDGIDGLLGMSFLSRFQVVMDGKSVRIRTRPAR